MELKVSRSGQAPGSQTDEESVVKGREMGKRTAMVAGVRQLG